MEDDEQNLESEMPLILDMATKAREGGIPVAYLAGPMTGYDDFNYPMFNEVAKWLAQEVGVLALNPAENFGGNPNHPGGFAAYMAADIVSVLNSDMLIMLPGWEKSRGATFEAYTAYLLNLPVWEYIPDGAEGPVMVPTKTDPRAALRRYLQKGSTLEVVTR